MRYWSKRRFQTNPSVTEAGGDGDLPFVLAAGSQPPQVSFSHTFLVTACLQRAVELKQSPNKFNSTLLSIYFLWYKDDNIPFLSENSSIRYFAVAFI